MFADLFLHPFSTLTMGSLFRLYMILVQVRHKKTKQGYESVIFPSPLHVQKLNLQAVEILKRISDHTITVSFTLIDMMYETWIHVEPLKRFVKYHDFVRKNTFSSS